MKKMLLLFILIVLGSQVCFAEEININLLSYGAYSEGHTYSYSYTYHVPEGKKIKYAYISGNVESTANPVEVIKVYKKPPMMKVSINVYNLSGGLIYSKSHNIYVGNSFTDYINGLNDDNRTKGFIVKVYVKDVFFTRFRSLNLHIVLENNTSNSKTQNNTTNNSIKTPIPLPAVILDLIVISIVALRIKSK